MAKYPVILFIPHGGVKTPPEVTGMTALSDKEVFEDSDPYTHQIYDLSDKVIGVVKSDYARTFVDLNRDLMGQFVMDRDGVFKRTTFQAEDIYKQGHEPSVEIMEDLAHKYYYPYHNQLREFNSGPDVWYGLNCHAMCDIGPPMAADAGKQRPKICIGNAKGLACAWEETERMADSFRRAFKLEKEDVQINDPFIGDAITQKYATKGVRWLLIEINQSLYMNPPWFNPENRHIARGRLIELNYMFEEALTLFFG